MCVKHFLPPITFTCRIVVNARYAEVRITLLVVCTISQNCLRNRISLYSFQFSNSNLYRHDFRILLFQKLEKLCLFKVGLDFLTHSVVAGKPVDVPRRGTIALNFVVGVDIAEIIAKRHVLCPLVRGFLVSDAPNPTILW